MLKGSDVWVAAVASSLLVAGCSGSECSEEHSEYLDNDPAAIVADALSEAPSKEFADMMAQVSQELPEEAKAHVRGVDFKTARGGDLVGDQQITDARKTTAQVLQVDLDSERERDPTSAQENIDTMGSVLAGHGTSSCGGLSGDKPEACVVAFLAIEVQRSKRRGTGLPTPPPFDAGAEGEGDIDSGADSGGPEVPEPDGGTTGGPVTWITCDARDVAGATPVTETTGDLSWSGRVLVEGTKSLSNARLTIAPGTVIIMGVDSFLDVGWNGTAASIYANGTPEQPIRFCGQFGDQGYWRGMNINTNVTSDSILSNVMIADAGRVSFSSPVTLDQVQVRNSAEGVFAVDFKAGSSALSVDGSAASPVVLTGPGAVTHFPLGGSLTGSADDRVHLSFAEIPADTTFHDLGVPYFQERGISVTGGVLTFEPGVVYQTEIDAWLDVGWNGTAATLHVNGTEQAPVVFAGAADEPGTWGGIIIGTGVLRSSNLSYTEIHNGGSTGQATLRLNSPILIDHVSLIDNATGVSVTAEGFAAGSTHLSVTGTTSTTARPLTADWDALVSVPQGGSFTGNALDQIEVSGDFTVIGTIPDLGVPYFVASSLSTMRGSELTIAPGVEFVMNADTHFEVGWNGTDAKIVANGTAAAPIRFSGAAALPGYWTGIMVRGNVRTDSSLSYLEVGHTGGTDARAAILVDTTVPITNTRFFDTSGPGISKLVANPTNYAATNTFENTVGTVVER